LLIIGCVAAAIWFWSLIMPILAIVVVVGVAISWLRVPTTTAALERTVSFRAVNARGPPR